MPFMEISRFDLTRAFKAAERFANSAEFFAFEIWKFGSHGLTLYTYPYIVNAVFSIEIYLKCIIFIERERTQTSKGHDIFKLFKHCSEQSQRVMSEQFDSLIQEKYILFNALSELASSKFDRCISWDMESVLRDCKNAFVHFRYAFEGNACDFRAYRQLRESIRSHLIQMEVDLAPERFEFLDYQDFLFSQYENPSIIASGKGDGGLISNVPRSPSTYFLPIAPSLQQNFTQPFPLTCLPND